MAESNPPSLIHVHSLNPPTAGVRSWSSIPHPSPHTPLLATATSDRSVNIWDMREWKLLSTIAGGHKRSVRCVGWKDYGDYDGSTKRQRRETGSTTTTEKKPVILATGSFDANCGLWVWNNDRSTGSDDALATTGDGEQQQRSVPGAFEAEELEAERDFTRATGDDEADEDEEWHFSTLLTGPDSEIKDLQFSPPHYGANLLATCSRDKSVWVWEEVEPEEWETVAVLSEHTGDVKCVSWLKGARTTKGELSRRLAGRSGVKESDDADEEIILGGRELLATGSYDDTIRLHHDDEAEGDWLTIAVLTGHEGTVWDLKFESHVNLSSYPSDTTAAEIVVEWAPRLLSCSDDMTIRLWKKKLSDKEQDEKNERITEVRQGLAGGVSNDGIAATRQTGFASSRIPSVIRPPTSTEKWLEESRLPTAHVRSIYAVDWSERTGLIVSCGGDGIIAVYQEVPSSVPGDVVMNGKSEHDNYPKRLPTEWKIVATIEEAHDEYEINHVCWAPRRDHRRQEGDQGVISSDDEEYIVSTGDDGQVRIWQLPEEVLKSIR